MLARGSKLVPFQLSVEGVEGRHYSYFFRSVSLKRAFKRIKKYFVLYPDDSITLTLLPFNEVVYHGLVRDIC